MKITLVIAGFLFALFAALQLNDSHSELWIGMFATTSLLTFLTLGKRVPSMLLALAAIACLVIAAWTASIEFKNPGCRIGTDVPGPVLCGFWLAWLAWWSRAKGAVAAL